MKTVRVKSVSDVTLVLGLEQPIYEQTFPPFLCVWAAPLRWKWF